MSEKKIGDFEIIDHGIEHSQYFQGCGVAFTSFENVVTGTGDNPAEAIEDCLEQMAQCGFDTEGMEARIIEQEGLEALPIMPNVQNLLANNAEIVYGNTCGGLSPIGNIEIYYHVSIRWNEKGVLTAKKIGDFEIIDHGIEHSQRFPGCGIALTRFENIVTGTGDNPAEAIEDCLEQMAQCDFDTEGMEARIIEQEGLEALPTTPDVKAIYGNIESVSYHVSIQWKEVS